MSVWLLECFKLSVGLLPAMWRTLSEYDCSSVAILSVTLCSCCLNVSTGVRYQPYHTAQPFNNLYERILRIYYQAKFVKLFLLYINSYLKLLHDGPALSSKSAIRTDAMLMFNNIDVSFRIISVRLQNYLLRPADSQIWDILERFRNP